jgi:hypothetical protein
MKRSLQALVLGCLLANEALANPPSSQTQQGRASVENYQILLELGADAFCDLNTVYLEGQSAFRLSELFPDHIKPSHYHIVRKQILRDSITCATHEENLKRYEQLSSSVQNYRTSLEANGDLSLLDRTDLAFLSSKERSLQIEEEFALDYLRAFPIDCDSVADKGQLQQDKLLVVPRAVYDTFTSLKVPVQTVQRMSVPESDTPQSANQDSKSKFCGFVEAGYVAPTKIPKETTCREGVELISAFSSAYQIGFIQDCITGARLSFNSVTGWVNSSSIAYPSKNVCSGGSQ